jgi:hypothetical protein
MKKKKQEVKSKIKEKINEIYQENEYANLVQNKNRSRSITVGTAFGGAVEISMRGDYHNLWAIIQPVEVVELIEQLASGVGLQVAMRPKQDFASWRGWNVDIEDRYWAGSAPRQIEETSQSHEKLLTQAKEENSNKLQEDIQSKLQHELRKNVANDITEMRQELEDDVAEFKECLKEELVNLNINQEEKLIDNE